MMFKVGDIVEAFGLSGKVINIVGCATELSPINVLLDGYFATFTLDGKAQIWHKEPSLKLVERPRAKVKKTLYAPIKKSIDGYYIGGTLYENKNQCRDSIVGWGPAIEIEIDDEG